MLKWVTGAVLFFTTLYAMAVDVGQRPPNFQMPGTTGKIALADYKGQVVLINFWASWCGPCRKELPELEALYQQHRDKGFTIIGVNIDKERKNANEFIEKFHLSFPVGFDPDSKIISAFKGQAMPTSYLIGRDGLVKQVFLGFTSKKFPKMRDDIVATISTR